jgi:hypothetical protein
MTLKIYFTLLILSMLVGFGGHILSLNDEKREDMWTRVGMTGFGVAIVMLLGMLFYNIWTF